MNINQEEFTTLWNSGVTRKDMAAHFYISEDEIDRVRKHHGLLPRVIHFTFEDIKIDGFKHIDKKQLIDMYTAGVTVWDMAEQLGIPYSACCSMVRKLNLPKRKVPRQKNTLLPVAETRGADFNRMYNEGMTYVEIADKFGISVECCEIIGELLNHSEKK